MTADKAREMTLGPAALARLLDVSRQTVHDWTKAGMPRLPSGKYRLADVLPWLRRRDVKAAPTGPLAVERRRLLIEQRRAHEIDNARRAAELLPAADVAADLRAVLATFDAELERLPSTAAPELVDQSDPSQIIARLRAACRLARERAGAAIARYGESLDEPAKPRRRGD